ncbi:MAG: response regulator transcription factor [bacterium]|nr:response regulator transcription factor [Candidatus Kapabacteria bacterium]
MKTILLIEDDPAIRLGLEESLQLEHFHVISAGDGILGQQMARQEKIDLILLDLMLPGKNGDEVCRELRRAGVDTPIIMITAKSEEIDKIVGLEIGADDYITKPFSIREVMARIRAVLRRGKAVVAELEECSFGDIHLDFRKQEAVKSAEALKLTSMEFKILKYFVEREGEVITRDMLLDDVWGYEAFPTTRTVDNYMLGLRKKIENNPSEPAHLLTVHKAGYKFVKG